MEISETGSASVLSASTVLLVDDDATSPIPALFISALATTEDTVAGFEAGGVDYITKPFQHDEVLARQRDNVHCTRTCRRPSP